MSDLNETVLAALEEALGNWDAYVEHTTETVVMVRDNLADETRRSEVDKRLAELDVERQRITELCELIVGIRERRLS